MNDRLKHIGIRFFWFLIFGGIIIAGSVLVYSYAPSEYNYTDDGFDWEYEPAASWASGNNISLDTHSHTLHSDGQLTVKQNVLWHIAHGYNACVITDHNTMSHKDDVEAAKVEFASECVVIMGMEWTTNRIHMNLIGIETWDFDENPINSIPTDQEIQDAITETHNQGGVVIVNHIPWSLARMDNHPTREQLRDWGADYIEIYNGGTYDEESDTFTDSNPTIGKIAATDMHSPSTVYGWTLLNASDFTEEAIMTELTALRTAIYYNETGSPDNTVTTENVWFKVVSPAYYIGEAFATVYDGQLDWFNIGMWAMWLGGAFVIAELIRFGNEKFWEKMNRKVETNT